MEQAIGSSGARIDDVRADDGRSAGKSAASWPAIFAGAFVAVSTSLILLALGSGLGFAQISPWPGHGVSARTFTVTTAIWLIVTQWLSAALGGYIAGRLRTKWVGTHTHEVFFRDTAHGLVTWSVATVFAAAVLAGSVTSLVGGGLHALGGAASHVRTADMRTAEGPGPSGPGAMPGPGLMPGAMMPGGPGLAYDIDKLFRPPSGAAGSAGAGSGYAAGGTGAGGNAAGNTGAGGNLAGNTGYSGTIEADMGSDPRAEAVAIALNAMSTGGVPEADRTYLAERVSAQTGVPPAQAQKRVDDFIASMQAAETQAKAAADKARKAAAEASIYLALSMLVGAFIASISAALGGRLRDEHI